MHVATNKKIVRTGMISDVPQTQYSAGDWDTFAIVHPPDAPDAFGVSFWAPHLSTPPLKRSHCSYFKK